MRGRPGSAPLSPSSPREPKRHEDVNNKRGDYLFTIPHTLYPCRPASDPPPPTASYKNKNGHQLATLLASQDSAKGNDCRPMPCTQAASTPAHPTCPKALTSHSTFHLPPPPSPPWLVGLPASAPLSPHPSAALTITKTMTSSATATAVIAAVMPIGCSLAFSPLKSSG